VSFFVLIDSKNTALYNFGNQNDAQNDSLIHQLQEDEGVNWIVLGENDRVHDQTISYFKIIRQPNGDIYLRLVDIFSTKNKRSASNHQQPSDQDYGG
jgi:hypothetical protein